MTNGENPRPFRPALHELPGRDINKSIRTALPISRPECCMCLPPLVLSHRRKLTRLQGEVFHDKMNDKKN